MLLIFFGCSMSQEEITRLATEEFKRKELLLKNERSLFCRQKVLEEAERQADSIILQLGINPLSDSLYRPVIPVKPTFVTTDSASINSEQSVKPITDSL